MIGYVQNLFQKIRKFLLFYCLFASRVCRLYKVIKRSIQTIQSRGYQFFRKHDNKILRNCAVRMMDGAVSGRPSSSRFFHFEILEEMSNLVLLITARLFSEIFFSRRNATGLLLLLIEKRSGEITVFDNFLGL